MKNVISKVEEYLKTQPYFGLVVLLLIASVGFNLYLLKQSNLLKESKNENKVQVVQNAKTTQLEAPWGVKNEVYTKYEDGKWKTYSTSTPITEAEIMKMKQDAIERDRAIREYFRKQDELMKEFWKSFLW